jgi:hypothetical protein
VEHNLYDRPDLVHWIYSRLAAQGYSGCAVSHILRDEVQDSVQGELLLHGLVRGGGATYCMLLTMHVGAVVVLIVSARAGRCGMTDRW